MPRWIVPACAFTALTLAVFAFAYNVRVAHTGGSDPAACIQNGRFVGNTGPCTYNPRTDTCPDAGLLDYGNACFIVVPEGRP